jgi:hypothetical protein
LIADNDLAVGRLVEAVPNIVDWKETAIFIVEDDAQSGPDDVDSHRSVLLVASPFAKRGFVDHTLYTTSGVLRTIELILEIPPMSQYDAAATPLVGAFNPIPDLSFFRRRDARISLDEKNLPFGSRCRGVPRHGLFRSRSHSGGLAERHHLALRQRSRFSNASFSSECFRSACIRN